jgi:hypothetical protein
MDRYSVVADFSLSSSSLPEQWQADSPQPGKQDITFLVSATDDLHVGSIFASTLQTDTQSTKIISLCELLSQTQLPKLEVLGYLEDQFWRHQIAATRPQEIPVQKSDLVSIADILGRKQATTTKQDTKYPLSTREK